MFFTPNPAGKPDPVLTVRRAFAKPHDMNSVIPLLLASILFFAPQAAFGATELTDQLFIGAESLARSRFEQAGQAFAQALAQEPGNAYARSRQALALAGAGRFDAAVAELQKALAARSDDLFALWTLGCLELLTGQTAPAETRFAAMLAADPGNVRGTLGQGLALLLGGRVAEGVTLLAKVQAAESQDGLDRFLTGLAYWMLDAPANARLELEATLELEPRNTAALELLGLVYRRQGKAPLAKSAWEQALAIDPNQPGARFFLSRLAEDEGLAAKLADKPEEAKRAYEYALSIDPGNEAAAKALGVPTMGRPQPGGNSPAVAPARPDRTAGEETSPRDDLLERAPAKKRVKKSKPANPGQAETKTEEKAGASDTGKASEATGEAGQ
jgi:tetratricopeptide (TPR) repeat protein